VFSSIPAHGSGLWPARG